MGYLTIGAPSVAVDPDSEPEPDTLRIVGGGEPPSWRYLQDGVEQAIVFEVHASILEDALSNVLDATDLAQAQDIAQTALNSYRTTP